MIISSDTAFACFDRLSIRAGISVKSKARADDHIERDILSANRLIEIARRRGFEARLTHLDWKGLQATALADPVLLLLRNGNVVIALRNGGDALEQIVVADPVYRDGEEFLLSRSALENAWGGEALLVRPRPVTSQVGGGRRFVAGLSSCAFAAALGLIFFSLGDVHPLVVMQQLFSSALTPSNSISPVMDPVINGIRAEMQANEPASGAHRAHPGPSIDSPSVRPIDDSKFSTARSQDYTNSAIFDGDKAAEMSAHTPSVFAETHADKPGMPLDSETQADRAEAPSNPRAEGREVVLPDGSDVVPLPEPTHRPVAANLENLDPKRNPNMGINESAALPFRAVAVLRGKPDQATSENASKVDNDRLHPENTAEASRELPSAGGANANTASGERTSRSTEISLFIARGDALISTGDITSARLFYERAANAGDGLAALRMGESYDPAFLAGTRVPGNRGDAATAAQWYLRALELGTLEAEVLFKAVTATGGYAVR